MALGTGYWLYWESFGYLWRVCCLISTAWDSRHSTPTDGPFLERISFLAPEKNAECNTDKETHSTRLCVWAQTNDLRGQGQGPAYFPVRSSELPGAAPSHAPGLSLRVAPSKSPVRSPSFSLTGRYPICQLNTPYWAVRLPWQWPNCSVHKPAVTHWMQTMNLPGEQIYALHAFSCKGLKLKIWSGCYSMSHPGPSNFFRI